MSDEPLTTPAHAVLRWCRERPQAVAVIEHGVPYSYATLARNIVQMAKALSGAGLGPRKLLGIECDWYYPSLVLILACEVLGAAHVAMSSSDLSADSVLLPHCDVLCVTSRIEQMLFHKPVIRLTPRYVLKVFRCPVCDDDFQLLNNSWSAGDIVRIGRTSGTTGRSKYVNFTRGCLRNKSAIVPYLVGFDTARLNFISTYSFMLTGTYADTMAALLSCATVIFSAGEDLAANIRELPACHTFMLVRDAVSLLSSNQFPHGRMDTCSIRIVGGPVSMARFTALRQQVTTSICVTYSMNETHFITTAAGDEPGTLLPDTSVRIIDGDGRDTTPGQPGRILARTTRMAAGYLGDDAETRTRFLDGWFLTNDIGFMPAPGQLVVLGRTDEIINLGGNKLAPEPVEDQIREIDGVVDAAIVGLDNAEGTGELHIFIELDDPARNQMTQALIAPLLNDFRTPFHVHPVRRLPRTDTGKVRRAELKQSLTPPA